MKKSGDASQALLTAFSSASPATGETGYSMRWEFSSDQSANAAAGAQAADAVAYDQLFFKSNSCIIQLKMEV